MSLLIFFVVFACFASVGEACTMDDVWSEDGTGDVGSCLLIGSSAYPKDDCRAARAYQTCVNDLVSEGKVSADCAKWPQDAIDDACNGSTIQP